MNVISDTLRNEYKALKTLRVMAEELETQSFLIKTTLREQSDALDHLMRAKEENAKQQTQCAHAHFVRAGRDLYFLLLTSKLDRLRILSMYLPPKELARFRDEYQKIKDSVEIARTQTERKCSLNEYIESLAQIDSFLSSFADLEAQVATKRKVQTEKYKHVLIAILSALLGAVISILIQMLT